MRQIPAGQCIGLRREAGKLLNTKTMVSASSPALLLLCGDMRCYRLLETPLEAHLRVRFRDLGYGFFRAESLGERSHATHGLFSEGTWV